MDGVYYNGVKQWGLAYDANGNLTALTDGAGNTTSSKSYDKNNRLTQQAEGASNSIAYGYDENSNLTSLTATAGTTTVATGYSYNPMNLMVAVSRNGANQAKFVYDERGNVTSTTYSNGTYAANEYDAANRLKSVKNYNAAGVLLDSQSFSYDANSNITSIVTGAGTISYQYDALNQLTQETLLDGHGDVVKLTDSSGNVVAQYQYDAWGNIISQVGTMASANPYRYAGYRYDEATGLYYLMARYYDAGVGRFISRDLLMDLGIGH